MIRGQRSVSNYQSETPQQKHKQHNTNNQCELEKQYGTINNDQIDRLEKNLIDELKKTMFNSPDKASIRNRMSSLHHETAGSGEKQYNSNTQQRKEKLMQCAEGIFQGRLNELNEYNQDYFDHIAKKCVCARCTCGKHKCNQLGHLVYDTKGQPNTLYQDTYKDKDFNKAKPAQPACPLDNINVQKDLKFENHTTHRDHFTPKKAQRTESLIKKPDNIQLPLMPNDGTTTYRDVHNLKGFIPCMQFIPVSSLGIVKNAPFKGSTEHKQQFNPNKLSMYSPNDKRDMLKHSNGVNMGIDQSKLPNFYQSTYQSYHSPMKSSPHERNVGDSLKKMSQIPTNKDGIEFNHNTTHRDHYRNRFNKLCPITIENYEKTNRTAYPHNTDLDKLNMSVNI